LEGAARFRVNVFKDRTGIGAVLRQIPSKIPTADDLNLPAAVRDLCMLPKGLVVVTGPTGSGKSTTLAAMVDLINKSRADHIITIEDPIEFVHQPRKALINQREVHMHTKSFSNALRAALREDPDIVLVGEMRDLETTEIAIETAETGHLVFGTLHTNTAMSTVDRIIDKFPPERQNQIRTMLASSLRGVVAQTLCRKRGGGRVAAMEILIVTPAVASNIREGKTHQISSAMQTGKRVGMQVMDDCLVRLAQEGLITAEEAHTRAIDKTAILKKLEQMSVEHGGESGERPAGPLRLSEKGSRYNDDKRKMAEWRDMLTKDPNCWEALNNLAWFMATNPHDDLRDGPNAVALAEHAQSLDIAERDEVSILDTLSAAYAEHNEFDKALQCARQALEMAREGGRKSSEKLLLKAIANYEAGQPMRDD
jgi:twitching motility protein PilT